MVVNDISWKGTTGGDKRDRVPFASRDEEPVPFVPRKSYKTETERTVQGSNRPPLDKKWDLYSLLIAQFGLFKNSF